MSEVGQLGQHRNVNGGDRLLPAERVKLLAKSDRYTHWLSLENSGFSQLCRKAMEWLSDDTTHFHYSL